jgi:hypothetical protein
VVDLLVMLLLSSSFGKDFVDIFFGIFFGKDFVEASDVDVDVDVDVKVVVVVVVPNRFR